MRTATHSAPGPVTFDLDCRIGYVSIVADSDHDTARVELVAHDPGETLAASVIADAEITSDDGRFTVRIPWPDSTTLVEQVSGGGSVVNSFTGSNSGNLVQAGDIHVDGDFFAAATSHSAPPRSAGITIRAYLPVQSSLLVKAGVADVVASGIYESAEIRTTIGAITVGSVLGDAELSSNTGDISIGLATNALLKNGIGDIRVGGVQVVTATATTGEIRVDDVGQRADLRTTIGNIKVASAHKCTVKARTSTGNIRATGTGIDLDADTSIGKVRHL